MKKPTLVRRVSDMFRDGTSRPPSLSIQRIRDCCQNLNLLPYLLCSYGNSKTHPITIKVNMYINLLKSVAHHVVILYAKLQFCILQSLSFDVKGKSKDAKKTENDGGKSLLIKPQQPDNKVNIIVSNGSNGSNKRRKGTPVILLLVIYLVPLVLGFQVIGLCCLMSFGKYTPGFVFLVIALLCLGFISTKVMFHNSLLVQTKRKKRNAVVPVDAAKRKID